MNNEISSREQDLSSLRVKVEGLDMSSTEIHIRDNHIDGFGPWEVRKNTPVS